MARGKTEHILEVKEQGLEKISMASKELSSLRREASKLSKQFQKGEIDSKKYSDGMAGLLDKIAKGRLKVKQLKEEQKKLEGQTKKSEKSFREFSKSVQKTNRILRDAARIATGMLAAFGIQATARGLGTLAKGFIDVSKAAELYQKRLELLLGSQTKAKQVFEFMMEYGIKTGHAYQAQMEGITELAAVMRSQEGKDIIEWIKMAGDFTAVFATKGMDFQTTLTNIVRAASAGMGAAITFMRRGISEALEFRKGVKYTREDIVRRFSEVWKKAYKGAADEIGETFWGLMERLKNWFWKFRLDIMDAGIFEVLKGGAEDFLNKLEEMRKTGEIHKLIDEFSLSMVTATLALATFTQRLDELYISIREFVKEHSGAIKKGVGIGKKIAEWSPIGMYVKGMKFAGKQFAPAGEQMKRLGAFPFEYFGAEAPEFLKRRPEEMMGPRVPEKSIITTPLERTIERLTNVQERIEKRISTTDYTAKAREKLSAEREMGKIKFMFPKGQEEYRLEKELIAARKGVQLAEMEEPRYGERFTGAGMRRKEVIEIERENMKEQMRIQKELTDFKLKQIRIEMEGERERYKEEKELYGKQVEYNEEKLKEHNAKVEELERKIIDETSETEKEKLRDTLEERKSAWEETKEGLDGYSDYLETVVLKHEKSIKESEKKKKGIVRDSLDERKKLIHEYNEKFRIIDAGTVEAFILGWEDSVSQFGTLSEQIYEIGKQSFDNLKSAVQDFYKDLITLPLRKKEADARIKELEAEATMMQNIYQMKLDNINKELQLNQMRRDSDMIGEDMYTTEYIGIMNEREKLQKEHANDMIDIHEKMQGEMQDNMKSFADYWDAFWTQMANVAAEQMARTTMSFLSAKQGGGLNIGTLISGIGGLLGFGGAQPYMPPEGTPGGFLAYQHGGIVHSPQIAKVGEGIHSEAIVPLPDNRSIPVQFMGKESGQIVNVFNISAVDANSFVELCRKNPAGIVSAVNTDITNGGSTMTTVRSVV